MATIKDFLKCPKCKKQMMRQSLHQEFGKEYFSHCCHEYFGVNELVNQWGYDAGDLVPSYPVTHANYKGWYPTEQVKWFSEFDSGEPMWATAYERVDAYKVVQRMFLGLPELEDYQDLMSTNEDALQIGVQ
jgi:hypothetical protein